MRYYTGVGNRELTREQYGLMYAAAYHLAILGWKARTGEARGADEATRKGAEAGGIPADVFVPEHTCPVAEQMAAEYHGAWHLCSPMGRAYHGRNVMQLLGPKLAEPSKFVVCCTWDKCKTHAARTRDTGGTGTVISLADARDIPLFNVAVEADFNRITEWLLKVAS